MFRSVTKTTVWHCCQHTEEIRLDWLVLNSQSCCFRHLLVKNGKRQTWKTTRLDCFLLPWWNGVAFGKQTKRPCVWAFMWSSKCNAYERKQNKVAKVTKAGWGNFFFFSMRGLWLEGLKNNYEKNQSFCHKYTMHKNIRGTFGSNACTHALQTDWKSSTSTLLIMDQRATCIARLFSIDLQKFKNWNKKNNNPVLCHQLVGLGHVWWHLSCCRY